MSRGAACGPPFGMGLDVESSGAGDGVPPVFRFLLGFRCVTGQSRARIVQEFTFGQGVGVTFYVQCGSRTAPTGKGVPARRGGAPSGGMGSCLRRNDGGVGGGWGDNHVVLLLCGHPPAHTSRASARAAPLGDGFTLRSDPPEADVPLSGRGLGVTGGVGS